MPGSCCAKAKTRIIKIAEVEAGIIGLDQALHEVYIVGVNGVEEIKLKLLLLIKGYGNYVSPSRENEYKQALLREYSAYKARIQREASQTNPQTQRR